MKYKCDICGKRMWWWQDTIMTTDSLGNVVVPLYHVKCKKKIKS